jgi:hypothetical protein
MMAERERESPEKKNNRLDGRWAPRGLCRTEGVRGGSMCQWEGKLGFRAHMQFNVSFIRREVRGYVSWSGDACVPGGT